MLEYLYIEGQRAPYPIKVRLDGKFIGTIQPEDGGFRYYPDGQKVGGDLYATVTLCQKSLANPED